MRILRRVNEVTRIHSLIVASYFNALSIPSSLLYDSAQILPAMLLRIRPLAT